MKTIKTMATKESNYSMRVMKDGENPKKPKLAPLSEEEKEIFSTPEEREKWYSKYGKNPKTFNQEMELQKKRKAEQRSLSSDR